MHKEKIGKLGKKGWKVGTVSEFLSHDSNNAYAQLGIADSHSMLFKVQLTTKIGEIIRHRRMTQTQASSSLPERTGLSE